MSRDTRPHPKTRGCYYRIEGPFDEQLAEDILDAAKASGLITLFDTGRGDVMWFEGKPGPEMRELRRKLGALVG